MFQQLPYELKSIVYDCVLNCSTNWDYSFTCKEWLYESIKRVGKHCSPSLSFFKHLIKRKKYTNDVKQYIKLHCSQKFDFFCETQYMFIVGHNLKLSKEIVGEFCEDKKTAISMSFSFWEDHCPLQCVCNSGSSAHIIWLFNYIKGIRIVEDIVLFYSKYLYLICIRKKYKALDYMKSHIIQWDSNLFVKLCCDCNLKCFKTILKIEFIKGCDIKTPLEFFKTNPNLVNSLITCGKLSFLKHLKLKYDLKCESSQLRLASKHHKHNIANWMITTYHFSRKQLNLLTNNMINALERPTAAMFLK